ncbi:uncharacterized protein BDZ99DRAFT_570842 [Mytilinidion resinicola]|uniref:Uncharacterized protein n=1 Tax=Mytilinidion resinicola TaxID=574789 RepID=A0A6A6YN76_9PEZI|nr:uncharacterized protein BDZ99DRAFT_570842 [Mytilinidion resinicola]KAF2810240.1 hypothetical protein BDZ99DRAFT_570842 [Mytilinidion resinicola]
MPVTSFLRRKSTGNELEASTDAGASSHGTFRTLDRAEVEAQAAARAAEQEKAQQKKGLFSRFSGGGNKPPGSANRRQHSFEDESPGGQRGSNGSSAANSALSRVYDTSSQSARHSSSSTLPSADDDNMFANTHPHTSPNHSALRSSHTWGGQGGPQVPPKSSNIERPTAQFRERSQTQSSYASTAIAPRVEASLPPSASSFSSEFDNMFESLESQPKSSNARSAAHESTLTTPGRSLLAGRQRFQQEPVNVERSLHVDPAPTSWDSRDSAERLILSPTDSEMSPPPVPPHAHLRTPSPSQQAAAASEPDTTETLYGGMSNRGGAKYNAVGSTNHFSKGKGKAPMPAASATAREPLREPLSTSAATRQPLSTSLTPRQAISTSASSSNTLQTPSSSRSASNNATPRAQGHSLVDGARMESVPLNSSPAVGTDDEDTPLFDAATISSVNAARRFAESEPPRRVMRAEDFRREQKLANSRPPPQDDSSEEENEYEDEDEEERHQAQRELRRRQEAQLAASREVMRRTVGNDSARPASQAGTIPSSGFPAHMSLHDDWDENADMPLGILKAHGFPSQGRPPTQPANYTPSYTGIAERPASAGALGNGQARSSVPVFARNLPLDPFRVEIPTDRQSFHLGGGNPLPGPRSSTGPPSAYGGSTNMSYMDVIQAEERAKAIRRGSPGHKHFGYGDTLHQQMPRTQTMSSMMQPPWGSQQQQFQQQQFQPQQFQPQQPFPMMPQMPMGGQPGGGAEFQMAFMMAQQMLMQQQQQAALVGQMGQMNLGGQPQPANPYAFQTNGFLAPNRAQNPNQLRPQSVASNVSAARPYGPNRTTSTPNPQPRAPQTGNVSLDSGFTSPFLGFSSQNGGGYAPSIAPSERSNIGLASRYRPVVASPPPDATSIGSSLTAQATAGAPGAAGAVNRAPSPLAGGEAEDAAWKSLGERRKKWGKKGKKGEGLGELWAGEREA